MIIFPYMPHLYKRLILQGFSAILHLPMETRPNQYIPTPDQLGVPDHVQHQAQNGVLFESPQSPVLTQDERQADRAGKKAAKKEQKAQEAADKKAKAEEFRVTHKGKSLVKKNQRSDQPDNSRFTTLGRRVTKIKSRNF